MKDILDQLDKSVILSADDIAMIKQIVAEKYATSSSSQKMAFFVKSVHKIVDTYLEGIEKEEWDDLKISLFKNTLAVNRNEISKRDVFEEIISLEMEVSDLCSTAYQWLSASNIENVSYGQMGRYVHQKVKENLMSEAEKMAEMEAEAEAEAEAAANLARIEAEAAAELERIEAEKAAELALIEAETLEKIQLKEHAEWLRQKDLDALIADQLPVTQNSTVYQLTHFGYYVIGSIGVATLVLAIYFYVNK
jgi:hypothetical protein